MNKSFCNKHCYIRPLNFLHVNFKHVLHAVLQVFSLCSCLWYTWPMYFTRISFPRWNTNRISVSIYSLHINKFLVNHHDVSVLLLWICLSSINTGFHSISDPSRTCFMHHWTVFHSHIILWKSSSWPSLKAPTLMNWTLNPSLISVVCRNTGLSFFLRCWSFLLCVITAFVFTGTA